MAPLLARARERKTTTWRKTTMVTRDMSREVMEEMSPGMCQKVN
jgi:hypothetical protein